MAIADDISVAANGDIRYTGTTTNYTVIELHRFLQDLADDAVASGNDLLDITDVTPSERSTDNIITLLGTYNIDDTLSEHLYDGSITQGSGGTQVRYSGLQIIGTFTATPQVVQDNAVVTPWWSTSFNPNATLGVAVQVLIKTMSAGSIIDGGRVRVQTRDYGYQYREASTVLGLGNSPAAPGNIQADPFNDTAIGTIEVLALDFATHADGGYNLIDLGEGSGNQPYYSEWDLNTASVTKKEFYEWIKWATRDGSTEQIFGIDGELYRGCTHEIVIDNPAGTFDAYEEVSWSGGTGLMLAIDSVTAGTKMWIQLLTGVAPTDDQTITGDSTATADVATTVTLRPIGVESAIGAYVGSLLGCYGMGVKADAVGNTDSFTDLNNVTRNPPNNVIFTVSGLSSGEDYILIGPRSAGLLQTDQLSLDGAHSGGEATVTIVEDVPSDTPTTGTFRVFNGSTFSRVTYTGWTGKTFTGCTGMPAASDQADVFISYLDKLATAATATFSCILGADRDLFMRGRYGGASSPIKTFETPAQLASLAATMIRVTDE
jgi:hypothetical protein